MALDERCRGPESYRALLARLWGLYAPLESALARIDWQGVEVDFPERLKLGWLEADLVFLGLDLAVIAQLPRASTLPRLTDRLGAMGMLYVMEGASLGGQIISRRLTADLGVTADRGGRFFSSYGRQVGQRWRDYLLALERFADDPAASARIEDSALATFESFLSWFAAGPRPVEIAMGAWS